MDLYTYLAKYRIKKQDFAKRLRIGRTYLHHMLNGRFPFTEDMQKRIIRLTKGEVTDFSGKKQRHPKKIQNKGGENADMR
jgi:hypothetical protein